MSNNIRDRNSKKYSERGEIIVDDKRYLNALESMFGKRYQKNEYKICGYQENSVCLEANGDTWVVYNGERGNRYNVVMCDTILMACLEIIRKMTKDSVQIKEMEDELLFLVAVYDKDCSR